MVLSIPQAFGSDGDQQLFDVITVTSPNVDIIWKKKWKKVRVIRSAKENHTKKVKVSWTLRCNLKWRWSTHKHTSQTFNSKESSKNPLCLQAVTSQFWSDFKKNRKLAHENRKKTTNLSKLTDSRIPPTKILWCPKLGGGFNTNWTILAKLHHSPGIGVKIKNAWNHRSCRSHRVGAVMLRQSIVSLVLWGLKPPPS